MRCAICDSVLSENEVKWNMFHGEFDPCGTCLEVIDAVFEDPIPDEQRKPDSEEEIMAEISALEEST